MSYVKLFIMLCFALLLTGCLSPVQSETDNVYILNTIPNHIPKKLTHATTLLVMQPDTRPLYNTTKMAYTIKPYQVSFFGRNQWGETPSQMLQPLMVQTLQNTHYYHAVVTPPFLGRYDYMLTTQILKLQQNFVRCPNVIELSVRAQITRATTNHVIATKQFNIAVPIRQRTPYSGVMAANQATAQLLAELTNFTLGTT